MGSPGVKIPQVPVRTYGDLVPFDYVLSIRSLVVVVPVDMWTDVVNTRPRHEFRGSSGVDCVWTSGDESVTKGVHRVERAGSE